MKCNSSHWDCKVDAFITKLPSTEHNKAVNEQYEWHLIGTHHTDLYRKCSHSSSESKNRNARTPMKSHATQMLSSLASTSRIFHMEPISPSLYVVGDVYALIKPSVRGPGTLIFDHKSMFAFLWRHKIYCSRRLAEVGVSTGDLGIQMRRLSRRERESERDWKRHLKTRSGWGGLVSLSAPAWGAI